MIIRLRGCWPDDAMSLGSLLLGYALWGGGTWARTCWFLGLFVSSFNGSQTATRRFLFVGWLVGIWNIHNHGYMLPLASHKTNPDSSWLHATTLAKINH